MYGVITYIRCSLYLCICWCHCSMCAHNLSLCFPPLGRQSINSFQRVNMSSPSTSYSDTESSTSSHSSSDESVGRGEASKHPERGEPSKDPEGGEPSKRPKLKVISARLHTTFGLPEATYLLPE